MLILLGIASICIDSNIGIRIQSETISLASNPENLNLSQSSCLLITKTVCPSPCSLISFNTQYIVSSLLRPMMLITSPLETLSKLSLKCLLNSSSSVAK